MQRSPKRKEKLLGQCKCTYLFPPTAFIKKLEYEIWSLGQITWREICDKSTSTSSGSRHFQSRKGPRLTQLGPFEPEPHLTL